MERSAALALADLGERPTRAEVVSWLASLPAEEMRDFEGLLTALVSTRPAIAELLREILSDVEQPEAVRYAAFFALCTYCRRFRNITEFHKLLLVHEDEFSQQGTFDHLYAMALKARARGTDLGDSIQRAERAVSKLPAHPGILHSFAESVVEALEQGVDVEDRDGLLAHATERLDEAMALDPDYAKFFCTQGRLAALRADYAAARDLIQEAIDKEDSARQDYLLRVSDYQDHLVRVQLRQASEQLRTELAAGLAKLHEQARHVESSLEETKSRHLEFLGFFTAVVALTIGSIQLAQRESVLEAAQVVLVLAGGLLAAFGGLGVIIGGKHRLARAAVLVALGLLLCLGSLWGLPEMLR